MQHYKNSGLCLTFKTILFKQMIFFLSFVAIACLLVLKKKDPGTTNLFSSMCFFLHTVSDTVEAFGIEIDKNFLTITEKSLYSCYYHCFCYCSFSNKYHIKVFFFFEHSVVSQKRNKCPVLNKHPVSNKQPPERYQKYM